MGAASSPTQAVLQSKAQGTGASISPTQDTPPAPSLSIGAKLPPKPGFTPTSVTYESPASCVPVSSWRSLRLTPAPFSCKEKGGQGPLTAGPQN